MSAAVEVEVEQDSSIDQAAGPASPASAALLDDAGSGNFAVAAAPTAMARWPDFMMLAAFNDSTVAA